MPGNEEYSYCKAFYRNVVAEISPRRAALLMFVIEHPCRCRSALHNRSKMVKDKHSILPSETAEGWEERQTPKGGAYGMTVAAFMYLHIR